MELFSHLETGFDKYAVSWGAYEIGPNSIVAAGSVVTRSVPPGEVWGGVPAHFIETTKEYADKCKKNRLPYDMKAYKDDMKSEVLRVKHVKNSAFLMNNKEKRGNKNVSI